MWHLEMRGDGSATVFHGGLDTPNTERRFTAAPKTLAEIVRAVENAHFFGLAEFIGPSAIPIHGPENTLHIKLKARARKVTLHDPANRFKAVWKAVAAASPIKPPL